jgi:predicted transcriptional regulator
MNTPSVKSDLLSIIAKLPDSASYEEAMYELYVRMKIAQGRQAADEGRVLSHEQVMKKYADR